MPTAWCQTMAMTVVQYAREPVSEWANDPSVNVALLRRALDDLAAAEALTPPLSHFYRGQYRVADDSLDYPQPLIAERAKHLADAGTGDLSAYAPDLDAFLRGEPERSRRVLRLLAANDLAWCDVPASERPPVAVPRLRIYQADPSTPPAARALPPEELARWADSVLIHPAPDWRMGELEMWDQNDRRSMGQLKEAVAVPLFTREMGRPPASSAEALRRHLPIPGDTPDRDEAEPLPGRAGAGLVPGWRRGPTNKKWKMTSREHDRGLTPSLFYTTRRESWQDRGRLGKKVSPPGAGAPGRRSHTNGVTS